VFGRCPFHCNNTGWGIRAHLTSPDNVIWYVAIVGKQPGEPLQEQRTAALGGGVQRLLLEAYTALSTRHDHEKPTDIPFEKWLALDDR
jgi:hypothetical protein